MIISDELLDFFNKHRGYLGRGTDRYAEIFLHYYGFLDAEIPTYEDTGVVFGGVSRERIRQLIQRSLDLLINTSQPVISLLQAAEIITSQPLMTTLTLANKLAENGLITLDDFNPLGLLRLLNSMNFCEGYGIYKSNLYKVKFEEYSRHNSYLLIYTDDKNRVYQELKNGLKIAKQLSGNLGLLSLSYLHDALGDNYPFKEEIDFLITTDTENVCFQDERSETYFHIGRFIKDRFTSCLGKIFTITERVQINELAEAMRRPIQLHQGSRATTLLPISIINQFIMQYPLLHVEDNFVYYSGECKPARRIELDSALYLRVHDNVKYLELYAYLEGKGHLVDNIKMTIYHSPIININRVEGFGNYKFSLIGQGDWRNLVFSEEFNLETGELITRQTNGDDAGTGKTSTQQSDCDKGRGNASREDFEKAKLHAQKTGILGEKFVNHHFSALLEKGEILEFRWESEMYPGAPYDFWYRTLDTAQYFVDVKTTEGSFNNDIRISDAELRKMGQDDKYSIFRLYEVDETIAKIRICNNLGEFAKAVLDYAFGLPFGVFLSGIMVNPENLQFDGEFSIKYPEPEQALMNREVSGCVGSNRASGINPLQKENET